MVLPTDPYERYKKMLPQYLRSRSQAVILKEIILSGRQRLSLDTLVKSVQKYGLNRWEAEKAVMDLAFVGVRRGYSRAGIFDKVTNTWYGSSDADVVVRVVDEMLASPVFGVYVEMVKAPEAVPEEAKEAPVKEEKKVSWCEKLRRFFSKKKA